MHPPDHDIRNRLLIARLPAMPQILIKLIELLQADDAGTPERLLDETALFLHRSQANLPEAQRRIMRRTARP